MKRYSMTALAGVSAFAIAALAGCDATDVVAKIAKTSFSSAVTALPSEPAWVEDKASWEIVSPGGDRLYLSADFSGNGSPGTPSGPGKPDAALAFDAGPFLAAGLDAAKLPAAEGLSYGLENGEFLIRFELGSDAFSPEARKSLIATFDGLVEFQRSRIGYHEKLDHYGIMLGNGNMFEWAKDTATNDKDIVFVLNPEPFIDAGVDPSKLEGWVYAPVETKNEEGKMITVDKFLKPYDLK